MVAAMITIIAMSQVATPAAALRDAVGAGGVVFLARCDVIALSAAAG
jgi:hypothetical protein